MFAKTTEATIKFLFQKDIGGNYRKCCTISMLELKIFQLSQLPDC